MSVSRWQTFPVELNEGLITSKQPVALGLENPGAARRLTNLEVSLDGGYSRILGYSKYSEEEVPPYGMPVVHLSGQTGTTLIVANLAAAPLVNDQFTIDGVTGTYTVTSVSFSQTTRRASLGITPTLASSPADRADVTFTGVATENVEGVFVMNDGSVAVKRQGALFKGFGSGWTMMSVPNPGNNVRLHEEALAGSTIILENLTVRPQPQDTFTITGVEGVFTVTEATELVAGESTLTIDPALAGTVAINTTVTFIGAGLQPGGASTKLRATSYRLGTQCETVFVDGVNRPYKVVCATGAFQWLDNVPSDAVGADQVAFVRSTMFFGKGSILTYSAPATDNNYNTGDGAGVINVGDNIVSIIPFKDNLVIFGRNRIRVLSGSSSADFTLKSFTDRIGCVSGDSVLEVGGDVMYLAPDGVRFLSDTDRSGDLTLNTASESIRKDVLSFISQNQSFHAILVRNKNQYRLFGYTDSLDSKFSLGWCGTQFANQGESRVRWSQLQGFKVYSGHSLYTNSTETVVFTNRSPIIYRAESGNTFDGEYFNWSFWSPFWSFTDPVKRKTLFKVNFYFRLVGSFNCLLNVVLDFEDKGIIQPAVLELVSDGTETSTYGSPNTVYGMSLYGANIRTYFGAQTTGAGHNFSVKLSGTSESLPFTLDTLMIEFSEQGRK